MKVEINSCESVSSAILVEDIFTNGIKDSESVVDRDPITIGSSDRPGNVNDQSILIAREDISQSSVAIRKDISPIIQSQSPSIQVWSAPIPQYPSLPALPTCSVSSTHPPTKSTAPTSLVQSPLSFQDTSAAPISSPSPPTDLQISLETSSTWISPNVSLVPLHVSSKTRLRQSPVQFPISSSTSPVADAPIAMGLDSSPIRELRSPTLDNRRKSRGPSIKIPLPRQSITPASMNTSPTVATPIYPSIKIKYAGSELTSFSPKRRKTSSHEEIQDCIVVRYDFENVIS
jgi:hypothetical protein